MVNMYVARRELKAMFKGKVVTYQNGDEIPDFDEWDIHAHRAHLNMEWVEKLDDVKCPPAKKVAQKKKVTQKASVTSCVTKEAAPKAKKPKAKPKKADKKIHAT